MLTEEPVRGSHAYLERPDLFALSGLEQLRIWIDGRASQPPITRLTGLAATGAAAGETTWTMPASPWWVAPTGLFPGGVLAFAADGALAGAIWVGLPRSMTLITSELSVHFVRPATPASDSIVARGRPIHTGRRQGLSEARVEDAGGRLLAHAVSRCLLRPLPFEPPAPADGFALVEQPPDLDTDPHRRRMTPTIVPQPIWDTTPGLELLTSGLGSGNYLSSMCRQMGWRVREVSEGSATWSMPASLWFTTGFGTFYGGALALFADGALNAAVTSTLPPATSFGPLDLNLNFLRPVTPDGRDLVARATVVRRGQTIVVSTATIEDADGKPVVMATSSAMLLPDRPWNPSTEWTGADRQVSGPST